MRKEVTPGNPFNKKNMKKTIVFTTFIVALLAGCVHNEIPDNTSPAGERTLILTASMPGDDGGSSGTRLVLSENEEGITVKWKEGDVLNLCFVSGGEGVVKTVSAVPVTNISEDGKTGDFAINIPVGITEPFDLYGVYGAEFTGADSEEILFPAMPSGAALSDSEPLCVLRFEAKNLTGTTPVSVSFSHLGALLGISLINGSESSYTVNSLSVSSSGSNWLFNATGGATYDITTGEFTDNKAGDAFLFPAMATTIAGGTSEKAYCWFVPIIPAVSAGNITVTLNGTAMAQPLPAKTFTAGKYYRLALVWDGTEWKHARMPSATGLVAHWKFDGDANDAVGTNDGTVHGATLTTDRFGNANSAYSFDGRDDYIQCPQTGILGANARSFSFWAKAGSLNSGGNNVIISYGGTIYDAGGRFEIALRSDRVEVDISSSYLSKEYTSVGDGNWHFYTIVFEGGAGKTLSDLKYYADGRLLTVAKAWAGNAPINTLTTNSINIGRLFTGGRYFSGVIDDIRMYDEALSAEEIIWLYQSESIGMAVNPLSRFATHNLDVLNTFAAGDEQTTKGKMYQWGRNIPFPAEGTITTAPGQATSLNDSKVWSDGFISGDASWHPSPNRTDTWRSLVAQASSAPESYRGTNTRYVGDPCPDGWHLPSPAEWTAILPFSGATYGFSFNDHSDRSEAIDLDNDGTPENWLADYRKITDNSMVGLKYKGTSLATAFKYEWISATNAMKISAVQANAFTTIGQVRDASFDWSGAVVRYFPTAGNRSSSNGTIDATYGNVGFYWTSEAAPDATYDIWLAYIKNTTAYITRDDAGSILAKRGNGYLVRCIKN